MNIQRAPKEIDGIKCYAPELAYANENYSVAAFERLFKAEDGHFWFQSRNRIIRHLIKKIRTKRSGRINFLEIGCGTGYVLKGLSDMENMTLQGSEIFLEGLKFAKKRLPGIELIQLDATRMPFTATFDVVGAFDVLEHIDEDVKVLEQVRASLKPSGYFLISVPQHRFLWSYLDDMAYHKRRYSRREMKRKLNNAGFEIEFITSFVFMLFPVMFLSRLIKGKGKGKYDLDAQMKELELPAGINKLFSGFMRIDEWLIKKGISLPFGGSLMAVARKKE